MNPHGPPEPPGGQDDNPPDLRRALFVVLLLLTDVSAYLGGEGGTDAAHDLSLRIRAVSAVLERISEGLDRDR